MANKKQDTILDVGLLKRLIYYTKPYKKVFIGVFFAVILLAAFSSAIPYITQYVVDHNVTNRDPEGFLFLIVIMLGLLKHKRCSSYFLFIMLDGWGKMWLKIFG